MTATRQDVVAEALRWEGTPYAHRARVMGVGVDCANLPAAVYEAVGLVPHIDPEYTSQWWMHRDEEMFLGQITPHATEISFELLGPGDIVVYRYGRTFSHSVIVLDMPEGLHASMQDGSVCRTNLLRDSMHLDRERRSFTLWPA